MAVHFDSSYDKPWGPLGISCMHRVKWLDCLKAARLDLHPRGADGRFELTARGRGRNNL